MDGSKPDALHAFTRRTGTPGGSAACETATRDLPRLPPYFFATSNLIFVDDGQVADRRAARRANEMMMRKAAMSCMRLVAQRHGEYVRHLWLGHCSYSYSERRTALQVHFTSYLGPVVRTTAPPTWDLWAEQHDARPAVGAASQKGTLSHLTTAHLNLRQADLRQTKTHLPCERQHICTEVITVTRITTGAPDASARTKLDFSPALGAGHCWHNFLPLLRPLAATARPPRRRR